MNEPIITQSMFPVLTAEQKAYKKYAKATSTYATPLSFEKWLHDVKNVRVTC
jgi:hypothetical protein